MSGWTHEAPLLAGLDARWRAELERLVPVEVPAGAVLFSPGESVKGYVIVLSGRVSVHLTGPGGREILLYEVAPGQSCIQSTLGLLGGDDYTGEAVANVPTRLVLLPRPAFLNLLERSSGFRKLVFAAFAERMQSMMQLIENVSFMRVEERLAQLLLSRSSGGAVSMTQAEMARAIGTAREVVSRRLDRMARAGLLRAERGQVWLLDPARLEALAARAAL